VFTYFSLASFFESGLGSRFFVTFNNLAVNNQMVFNATTLRDQVYHPSWLPAPSSPGFGHA
jgi:hypothetical protein